MSAHTYVQQQKKSSFKHAICIWSIVVVMVVAEGIKNNLQPFGKKKVYSNYLRLRVRNKQTHKTHIRLFIVSTCTNFKLK
jgi:hypothetical protein